MRGRSQPSAPGAVHRPGSDGGGGADWLSAAACASARQQPPQEKARAPALPDRVASLGPLSPAGRVFEDSADDIVQEASIGVRTPPGVLADASSPSDSSAPAESSGDAVSCRVSAEAERAPAATMVPEPRWQEHRQRGVGGTASGYSTGSRGESLACPEDPGDRAPPEACEGRTTVILQCIPQRLDGNGVRSVLDELGFSGMYDAVYVPMKDPPNGRNLSYAFVNFVSPEGAKACIRDCTGRPFGDAETSRICAASYSRCQGLAYTSTRAEAWNCLIGAVSLSLSLCNFASGGGRGVTSGRSP